MATWRARIIPRVGRQVGGRGTTLRPRTNDQQSEQRDKSFCLAGWLPLHVPDEEDDGMDGWMDEQQQEPAGERRGGMMRQWQRGGRQRNSPWIYFCILFFIRCQHSICWVWDLIHRGGRPSAFSIIIISSGWLIPIVWMEWTGGIISRYSPHLMDLIWQGRRRLADK